MKSSILIVDSDASILALLSLMFEKNGLRALRSRTGEEALEIASRDHVPFGLVLCNRILAEAGLTERMRAIRPGIPVLVMSAGVDGEMLRVGLESEDGFDGDLMAAVRKAVTVTAPRSMGAAHRN